MRAPLFRTEETSAGTRPPIAAVMTAAAIKKTPMGRWRLTDVALVASQAATGRARVSTHKAIRRRIEGEECIFRLLLLKNHGDKAALQNSTASLESPSSEGLVLFRDLKRHHILSCSY